MSVLRPLIIIVVIAALFVLGYTYLKPESEPTPAVIENAQPMLKDSAVEAYVRDNISTLSPEPEQLGGTFYVTSIETHEGEGKVSYEDGHNAYTAAFTYTAGPNNAPQITSFVVE